MNMTTGITESDLQLLEEHLDGALDAVTEAGLRERLVSERALADELKALLSQRALRQAAYFTMQPSEVSVQQLMWRVRGAMLDQQQKPDLRADFGKRSSWGQWRIARIGSAAAACLVLGFFAGRLGRSGPATPAAPTSPAGILSPALPGTLTMEDHGSGTTAGFTPVSTVPKISVPITNEYGQVVAWQTFDNPEQAKSFAEDLGHAHAQQPTNNSVQPKLVDAPQPF